MKTVPLEAAVWAAITVVWVEDEADIRRKSAWKERKYWNKMYKISVKTKQKDLVVHAREEYYWAR